MKLSATDPFFFLFVKITSFRDLFSFNLWWGAKKETNWIQENTNEQINGSKKKKKKQSAVVGFELSTICQKYQMLC